MLLTNESVVGTVTTRPACSAAVAGAACSPSTASTRVPGLRALTAAATPLVRPPPPKGVSTQSGLGRSSTISSPMLPLPASTCASVTGLMSSSGPSGESVRTM